MFKNYIDSLLDKTIYYKDEDWVVIAKIPDKPGYFTQWENFEEARENMIDLIETLMIEDIKAWKIDLVKDFSMNKEVEYA
jgi:predicted RNase H-like HicB family nuclease